MAVRGGPTRRVVGNPLAGVLGHIDQRARIGGRKRTSAPEDGIVPLPPAAPVAAPGGPLAAVVATGEDGRARWEWAVPYGASPVVVAVAVDPDPGDEQRTVWATLEEVTSWYATVRVWQSRARRSPGVAAPAGPGVLVHVMATAVQCPV
ncbi:hypothetical protein [Streptomyces sp. NPDC088847]|uniref:hypothetical protein n=1 Tax=Streptomyces sp. NPDC088847 TaxID=3365909 RepID=UPI00380FE009